MKLTYFFINFLIFSFCKEVAHKKEQVPKNNIDNTHNKNIIGSRSMCAVSDDTQMAQYNVCQTIVFNSNGIGSVGNSYLELSLFNWESTEGLLKIVNQKNNPNNLFSDSIYSTSFFNDSNGITFLIKNEKHLSTYNLLR
jgi:hypothetical protein